MELFLILLSRAKSFTVKALVTYRRLIKMWQASNNLTLTYCKPTVKRQ